MSDHFIKNIEINNFKCFENFKADGFGRVNLIGGKNNVGKTAFMEVLQVAVHRYIIEEIPVELYLNILFTLFKQRNIEESRNKEYVSTLTILEYITPITFKVNDKLLDIQLKKDGLNNFLQINNEKYELPKDHTIDSKPYANFISSMHISNNIINGLYSILLEKRKRKEFNTVLNNFDKDIEEFELIDKVPHIFSTNRDKFIPLSDIGHGSKRYISIILAVLASEVGAIFIDEIENGIHYSKFDEMWEIILTISKDQNVQVFATTHSKECIESYARVAKKLEDEEIRFLSLYRNRENQLKSITFDYEKIQDRIELGLDNR